MAKSKLPEIKTVVVEDEQLGIGDAQRRENIEKATEAFFYHCNKQKLTLYDALVTLAGCYKLLEKQQGSVDAETEMGIMFQSLIENTTVKPNSKN